MRRKTFCRSALLAVLLSVLTACGRAETPGSTDGQETGAPENQEALKRGAEQPPGEICRGLSRERLPGRICQKPLQRR